MEVDQEQHSVFFQRPRVRRDDSLDRAERADDDQRRDEVARAWTEAGDDSVEHAGAPCRARARRT